MNNSIGLKDWLILIIKKDLLFSFKRSTTYITPVLFFLIVITFFPLVLGPDKGLLSSVSAGVIWVAALLSSLLAVESIFNEDFNDGSLDQLLISGEPTFLLVFAKVFSHWLVTGLPILIVSLVGAGVLFLSVTVLFPLLVSLFLGSIMFSLLGALGGALSLGRGAILSAILVLPFSIPILLLGSATINAAANFQDYSGYLFFLGAILAVGLPGICLVITEALFLNYE